MSDDPLPTGPSVGDRPSPVVRWRVPVRDGWWVVAMVVLGTLGLTAQAVYDHGDPLGIALARSAALAVGFGVVLFGAVRLAGLVWDGAGIVVDDEGLRIGFRRVRAAQLGAAHVVPPQQVEAAASSGCLGSRRVARTRRVVPRAAVPAVLVEQRTGDGPPRWWLIESRDPERFRDAVVASGRGARGQR
jgi:hypothetical protein